MLLEQRKAIVIGGTIGIGAGIAKVLREQGAQVIVTGVTEEECESAEQSGFKALQLDVRKLDECRKVVEQAAQKLSGLDIVACNAGVYPQSSIEEMSDEDFDAIFNINVKGMLHVVRAAMPHLEHTENAAIVVTSSITGNITGYPRWAHYGATKAAQMGFVRSAAIELAPKGIRINAVLPGNILTPGLKAMGEEYLTQMARSVPMGTLGTPEDIGGAVAFLASPPARYVTGQSIIVDGGQILPESPEALEELRA
ncbi:3-oxoacyl-ACP reductase FabG [Corynebacterium gerontici]|uniref:3-oxoacyl-[acyl-carrier-protein] reductase FabG n=1 Tax=Corynebacterium gerontici TaxID=2079234 RepID=A0A3G6IYK7_9CORY|nr:3-oxoacyl-ACP reductase FabG [Corynebacterium gerontici]AZA10757.1 3-oxoacyl-[acyl-carrier-protein] reductase FabG [Corynebacterium gerontici]